MASATLSHAPEVLHTRAGSCSSLDTTSSARSVVTPWQQLTYASRMKANAGTTAQLTISPPYRFDGLLAFIGPRVFPGIEEVRGSSYRRAVRTAHGPVIMTATIAHHANKLAVTLQRASGRVQGQARDAALSQARNFFDTERDPGPITATLAGDPVLRALIDRYRGLRIPGAWHPFELAVRAIIGQQVSVKAATTFASRLVIKYGEPLAPGLDPHGTLVRTFPAPHRLSRARLTSIGLVRARAKWISGLAQLLDEDPRLFERWTDPDQAIAELQRLPGIGAWTAHYIAMRALRHADAFPAADLGLMRAYSRLANRDVNAKALQTIAERWRPWRAYAAMLLWTADPAAGG